MAFITDIDCKECGETKHEITDNSGVCQNCRTKIINKKRRVHFAGLKGMTLEERIEKIEKQLYDLNIDQRIRAIEALNIKVY